MATVPGNPNVVPMLPEWAKPTQADFLQAAAIMHEREEQATFNERFMDRPGFVKEVAKDEWPLTQIGKRVNLQLNLEGVAEGKRMFGEKP